MNPRVHVEKPVDIQLVDTPELFVRLREEWDALLAVAEEASVFVSWEWLYNWWRHYGQGHKLRILIARENGRLTGILPLYVQSVALYRRFGVELVRFIGTGGDTAPDYLGPLLAPGMEERTARALSEHLVNALHGWTVLSLSDLKSESLFLGTLEAACRANGTAHTRTVSARIAYIPLPASWDDYLAGVSRDRRYTIRNTRKKFEALNDSKFYVWTEEEGVDRILDNLIDLHHRRWQEKGTPHAFSTSAYVGFHRDVIHACAPRGWIRFYCIEALGAPFAIFYCYRFRNQIFYFQAGFNPDYQRYRPGLVLIGYAAESAIQEGNTVFDFLRGEHLYKTQWGKASRMTQGISAYRPGLAARLYRLREERIPEWKSWLKQQYPFLVRIKRAIQQGQGNTAGHHADA
jgi:CelD/BcsL family acetyltransferase involved in cellulose biosynthesis